MTPIDRERILALRVGALGADPNGNVVVKVADLLYLTEIATRVLDMELTLAADQPTTETTPDVNRFDNIYMEDAA